MFWCQHELHSDVWQLFDFMLQCWWWISKCHLLFWKWTLLEGLSTRLFVSFCKYSENPFTSLLSWLSEVNWACFGTWHHRFLSVYIANVSWLLSLKFLQKLLFEIQLQLQFSINIDFRFIREIYGVCWDVEHHVLFLESLTF